MSTEDPIVVYLPGRNVGLFSQEATGFQRANALEAITDRLIHEKQGEILPGLLASWSSDEAGARWDFTLREGIVFHNGRALTSRDVKATFDNILSAPLSTPEKSLLGGTAAVEIIDDLHFRLTLKTPDRKLVARFSNSGLAPNPLECLRAGVTGNSAGSGSHLLWKDVPIGAGNYRVASVSADGASVILERFVQKNESYPWLETAPALVEIYTGEYRGADVVMGSDFNPDPKRLTLIPSTRTQSIRGIYFNYASPLSRQENFRRAVSLAFNREEICAHIGIGLPTWDTIPSEWRKHVLPKPEQNLEEAKQLFEEIVGNERLTVPSGGPIVRPVLNIISAQLSKAGLDVEFVPGALPASFEQTPEIPFFVLGFIPSVFEAKDVFEILRPGGSWVPHADADPLYLKSLKDLSDETDESKTRSLVEALSKRFSEKHYSIPLFEVKANYYIDTSRIESVRQDEQSLEFYIEKIIPR